jgi:predicted pyridoxine 5'-phosphate oxidase superfamily flavin-nucleotide-binding protein
MAETMTALPEELVEQLQKEPLVLLHTIDAESQVPTSSAISWVKALDAETLRVALDKRSRLIANMKANPKVTLTIFGAGSVFAVNGSAAVAAEEMEGVPLKLSCFDIKVEFVRDAMFYGARLSTEPAYEKIYNKAAAEKLDNQVFTAFATIPRA